MNSLRIVFTFAFFFLSSQGKVVYANYGRREDLETLRSEGINLTENIALVRAGELSLAEKVSQISFHICKSSHCPPLSPDWYERIYLLIVQVANAARFGLAAVLIYREPKNKGELSTELYGQVSAMMISRHLLISLFFFPIHLFHFCSSLNPGSPWNWRSLHSGVSFLQPHPVSSF